MRRILLVVGMLFAFSLPVEFVYAGDPLPPLPGQDPLPHEAISLNFGEVDGLLQQGTLTKQEHSFFDKVLSRAHLRLLTSDPIEAQDARIDFLDKKFDLIESKRLSPQQGDPLIALGATAVKGSEALSNPTPPSWPNVCPGGPAPPPPNKLPTLHVALSAPDGGDGSPDHLFQTLTPALDHAKDLDFEAVKIRLDDLGRYEEHIEITGHTRILGNDAVFAVPVLVGSVTNTGPYSLEVHNLAIDDLERSPTRAIFINHSYAATLLNEVAVLEATGFGIFQRGGQFSASTLIIDRTHPPSTTVGVAMQFEGGVMAELKEVILQRNQGGGPLIKGAGTPVIANRLSICDKYNMAGRNKVGIYVLSYRHSKLRFFELDHLVDDLGEKHDLAGSEWHTSGERWSG